MTICTKNFNSYGVFFFNRKDINLTMKKRVVAYFLFIIDLIPKRLDNLIYLPMQ